MSVEWSDIQYPILEKFKNLANKAETAEELMKILPILSEKSNEVVHRHFMEVNSIEDVKKMDVRKALTNRKIPIFTNESGTVAKEVRKREGLEPVD